MFLKQFKPPPEMVSDMSRSLLVRAPSDNEADISTVTPSGSVRYIFREAGCSKARSAGSGKDEINHDIVKGRKY